MTKHGHVTSDFSDPTTALPTYETLVVLWGQLAEVLPELSHYIKLGN